MSKKPTVLLILDGYGYNENEKGNAIFAAGEGNISGYLKKYPNDYSMRTYHISNLITLGYFNEAQVELKELENDIKSDKQFLNQNLESIQSKIDSDIKPLIAEQAASKSETKTTTQIVKKLLQQVQNTSEKSGIEKTEIDNAINESKQQSNVESQDKKKIDDSIKSLTLKNGKAGADISTQKNAQNISKIQTKVLPFVKALYTTPEIKKTNETILGQKNSTVGIQKLIKHYFKEWDDRDLNKDKFDSDLDSDTTQGIDDDETGSGSSSKRIFRFCIKWFKEYY